MADSWFDALSKLGRDNALTRAGEYWAEDNAQFDKGNPNLLSRMGRAINPMTGFGSAVGSMHKGAGEGDLLAMGGALIGALPLFGKVKTVMTPAGAVATPLVGRTVAAELGGAGLGAVKEDYDSRMRREVTTAAQQAEREHAIRLAIQAQGGGAYPNPNTAANWGGNAGGWQ